MLGIMAQHTQSQQSTKVLPDDVCSCWFCPVLSSAVMDGEVSCMLVPGGDFLWSRTSLPDSSESAWKWYESTTHWHQYV